MFKLNNKDVSDVEIYEIKILETKKMSASKTVVRKSLLKINNKPSRRLKSTIKTREQCVKSVQS